MTKSFYFLASIVVFIGWGCGKDDDNGISQAEIDDAIITNYLADNGLTAEEHPSGLRYIIDAPGTSDRPVAQNMVTIRYKGYFPDGTIFDQTDGNTSRTFLLANLIPAWQIGIPLIGRGGRIRLFVPSHLGYGAFPPPSIPANAILIFEVDLENFF